MSENLENIKENVEEIKEDLRDEVAQAKQSVEDKVNEAADAVAEGVEGAAEAVEACANETVEAAKEKVDEVSQAAAEQGKKLEEKKKELKEKVDKVSDDVKDKAQDVFKGAAAAYATAKEKAQDTVSDIKKEIDDYSGEMDSNDVSKNKFMAVLAYLGPLVVIPIFAAKKSKFARFHSNQGLVLFILAVICSIFATAKYVGWLFDICGAVVFVFGIIGIIYACQGKAKELPIVGNWKILE